MPPKVANPKPTLRTHRQSSKPEHRVRTLFFGTSEFAVPSLRVTAEETGLAAVVTQPDRPSGRGHKLTPTPVKKAAGIFGVPIYEPGSLQVFTREHADESYDLFVLASYGKILPAALLALPKLGALNVHPSLLPRYRGATPIQSALRNGDAQTGVTIMLMDAGMDTGPIVLQEPVAIGPDADYSSLHDVIAERGAELLRQAIRQARAGKIESRPQTGTPDDTKPLRKEDLAIDWKWPAQRIVNTVRAFSLTPAARATIEAVPVKILRAHVAAPTTAELSPGAIAGVSEDALVIACGDGAVAVESLIAPNKGRESGAKFWARMQIGVP